MHVIMTISAIISRLLTLLMITLMSATQTVVDGAGTEHDKPEAAELRAHLGHGPTSASHA